MPKKKRPTKPATDGPRKLRPDVAETAYRVMQEAIGERPKTKPPGQRPEAEKSPEAVRRGKAGGKKGGTSRAKKLTDDERARAATIAALARWKKGT